MTSFWKSNRYCGDNLGIVRDHIPSESVDLTYLDPPPDSDVTLRCPALRDVRREC